MIEGAIEFYKRYTAEGKGETLIKKAIQQQLRTQQEQAAEQRLQCEAEIERIDSFARTVPVPCSVFSLWMAGRLVGHREKTQRSAGKRSENHSMPRVSAARWLEQW